MPVHFDSAIKCILPGVVVGAENKKYRVKWDSEDGCYPHAAHGIHHWVEIKQTKWRAGEAKLTYRRKADDKVVLEEKGWGVDAGDIKVRRTLRRLDKEDQNVWMPFWAGQDKIIYHKVKNIDWGWNTRYIYNPGVFYHNTTTEDGVDISVGYPIYMRGRVYTVHAGYNKGRYTGVTYSFDMRDRREMLVGIAKTLAEHRRIHKLREDGREGEADLAHMRAERDDERMQDEIYAKIKARRNQP